jgi:hypothetical protein
MHCIKLWKGFDQNNKINVNAMIICMIAEKKSDIKIEMWNCLSLYNLLHKQIIIV